MLRSRVSLYSRRLLHTTRAQYYQNLTEKIAQKYAIPATSDVEYHTGDYITVKPYHCMTHDNSWPVALKFMNIGGKKIYDREQVILTIDHDVQNKSESNLTKYKNIENFAAKHNLQFYKPGAGIGHQIMIENGYAAPNTLTVASDSHSNTYGGIGCLGTPIVRTDAACIWATGQFWWQIPPVAKVELIGTLPEGVSGKDVIVGLCGVFNKDQVLNHCIEFTGSGVKSLPVDQRLTIANMTTEWGALSGLFPVDETLINWYKDQIKSKESNLYKTLKRQNRDPQEFIKELEYEAQNFTADSKAEYAKTLTIDLSSLTHYVSGPNSVKVAQPISKLADMKINKAYLVSCTNSRLSDLQSAAKVMKGHKVYPGVEMYIAAASKTIEEQAKKDGTWETLVEAGCKPLPSGCGPCIGLGAGLLEPGEVGISATNRNFKGRMGSKDALAFLASPAVVAASAIKGHMAAPNSIADEHFTSIKAEILANKESNKQETTKEKQEELKTEGNQESAPKVEILEGFPRNITGELVLCDQDNINTDGIYPGKYTYQDNIDKETMARVCMENYDSQFNTKVNKGDILVSGFNFGTGSSREQAATALLAKGVPLVVAGSFSNIFSRNSINNALLTLEIPKLVELLRKERAASESSSKELTWRTNYFLTWDVANSQVTVQKKGDPQPILQTKVGVLGKNLQEIIVKGGLEGWVMSKTAAEN